MQVRSNRVLLLLITITPLLVGGAVRSSPISVGGTMLEIPDPPGFARVTPDMTTLVRWHQQSVYGDNKLLISYIPESEVRTALDGGLPTSPREFSVQTAKSLIEHSLTSSEFSELKEVTKSKNDELFRQVNEKVPGLLENLNVMISEETGVELVLSQSQIVPLPPHEETDRTLSYSLLSKFDVRDETGDLISKAGTGTTSYVHVRGRLLILYSYAEETGLEWTREISSKWAASIVAANPSDLLQRANESVPRIIRGIDWGKVAGQAIAGGLIGLLLVRIGLVRHRGTDRAIEQSQDRRDG